MRRSTAPSKSVSSQYERRGAAVRAGEASSGGVERGAARATSSSSQRSAGPKLGSAKPTGNTVTDLRGAGLSVMAVDDELLARQRLSRLLSAMVDVELLGVFETGLELIEAARKDPPDVVLLDIQMPDLGGIEVAQLMAGESAVIFVTAHPEFALAAFEVEAIDYVLKPVEAGRLKAALDRVRARRVARLSSNGEGAGDPHLSRRLPIKTRLGLVLIDPADISDATLGDELVTIHAERQGALLSDWTLGALEEALEVRAPGRFLRVSRQALINLDKVEFLEPQESGGYLARLTNGAVITVSRQASRLLRRHLGV